MLTPEDLAQHFPSLKDQHYLNTAAEGIPPTSARRALLDYLDTKTLGMDGREALFATFDTCREAAAPIFRLPADEISFCSSTSEAYNLLATAIPFQSGDNIVISDLDFPSGATPWLRHPGSPEVRIWKQRDGVLHLEDLERLLDSQTRMVQLSLVSFLTGYRLEWPAVRDTVRSNSPDTILSVDVTQAAGRIELDCLDADCLFASSYKWLLGIHGSCVVGIPAHARGRLITRAGGWYHLENAFDADRFERAESFPGARGFAVGMPSFASLYALQEGMKLITQTGVARIASHSDPLVAQLQVGLEELGVQMMTPPQPGNSSGIVSFQHPEAAALNEHLRKRNLHIMHQAGRLRVSIHGYNSYADIENLLTAIRGF
ncbi:MAG: aminotransferase class V-fold PLP-dependent enzyme [Verrucomicrobiales bacterium]|jgi:selenocysteine lyase/cysteine desulfurase|nr:aminotransferase class V-fold PLP-dependent enzyme [Verrucomicrobiales bacterium]